MATVLARDEESIDSLMRRFKRVVDKSGLPKEIRKREFHLKKSKLRQRDIAAAKKRLQKQLARDKAMWEALQGSGGKRGGGKSGSSGRGGRGSRSSGSR